VNTLDVLNTAKTLLAPLGQPVHLADLLVIDAQGRLKLPDDDAQFVIHTITGTPNHEWGATTYGDVRVQIDAYSVVEGHALAMLQAAAPLLVAGKFRPGLLVPHARDGPYTGYGQLWDRGTSP
jgi:hypothetical protein